MADHHTKSGDLEPVFRETLFDADGVEFNYAGATLEWVARHKTSGTILTGTPTVVGDGTVQYALTPGQSDEAGEYQYLWRITISGRRQTVPNSGYRTWLNEADIDG